MLRRVGANNYSPGMYKAAFYTAFFPLLITISKALILRLLCSSVLISYNNVPILHKFIYIN